MGFREMGKWARGAMAGAALFGADATRNDAAAATPQQELQNGAQRDREVMEAKAAREAEINSWVQDFGVKGLTIDKLPVKGLTEAADVLVDGKIIGSISGTPRRFEQNQLRIEVAEMLRRQGYNAPVVERQQEILEDTRIPLAEEITYLDQAKTMAIMEQWGVKIDRYSLSMLHDPHNDPIVADPKSQLRDRNKKLTFSHDGDDTIIVTFVEKDGDVGTFKIVKGIPEGI